MLLSPNAKPGALSDDDVIQGLQALLTASLAASPATPISSDSVLVASLLGSSPACSGALSRSSMDMALLSPASPPGILVPLQLSAPHTSNIFNCALTGAPMSIPPWAKSPSSHRLSLDSTLLARPNKKPLSSKKRALLKTMSLDMVRWFARHYDNARSTLSTLRWKVCLCSCIHMQPVSSIAP